jgi:hypothetical protein
MIIEKEFVKTFDVDKGEFVQLTSDLNSEFFEKLRYLQTQIDLLKSKLENLLKSLKDGSFQIGSQEAEQIIQGIEIDFEKMLLKKNFFEMKFNEIEDRYKNFYSKLENSVSISDVQSTLNKIKKIESTYKALNGQNAKNVFIDIVDTVDILVHRTKNLEVALSIIQEINLGKKVNDVKLSFNDKDEFNIIKEMDDFKYKLDNS